MSSVKVISSACSEPEIWQSTNSRVPNRHQWVKFPPPANWSPVSLTSLLHFTSFSSSFHLTAGWRAGRRGAGEPEECLLFLVTSFLALCLSRLPLGVFFVSLVSGPRTRLPIASLVVLVMISLLSRPFVHKNGDFGWWAGHAPPSLWGNMW